MYHFYRIKLQFLTDSTDFKKPCERKPKNTFAHVCKICIYAKFAYMQITSMCTGYSLCWACCNVKHRQILNTFCQKFE